MHRDFKDVSFKIFKAIRFLFLPSVFVSACWFLLYSRTPDELKYFPLLWTIPVQASDLVLKTQILLKPSTYLRAFELGELQSLCASSTECSLEILQAAYGSEDTTAKLLQEFTIEELSQQLKITLKETLKEEASVVATSFAGFMTFTNVIWLFAILGIVLTVGPFIYRICLTLRIWSVFVEPLIDRVVIPMAKKMYAYGMVELFLYYASMTLVVQGLRYEIALCNHHMVGTIVALSGIIMFVMVTAIVMEDSRFFRLFNVNAEMAIHLFFCLATAPITVILDSDFLGFLVVTAMFSAFGFTVVCFGLCWMIGFNGKNAMHRSIVTSFLVVILFSSAIIYNPRLENESSWTHHLRPFSSGALVMGNVIYFLAGLIETTASFRNDEYVQKNMIMLSSLLVFMFVGFVFDMPGMANTATVFSVLWFVTKEYELLPNIFGSFTVIPLFLHFVGMYFVALELHHHPLFFKQMFTL